MEDRTKQKVLNNFKTNLKSLHKELGSNPEVFLEESSKVWEDFGHPSVYFHQQAIKESEVGNFLGVEHLKMIYAVLVAWGMHRMGDTNTKLVSFTKFIANFVDANGGYTEVGEKLHEYKESNLTLDKASPETIEHIAKLMVSLKVSGSGSQIVSASKTLHHILPNLVPPIDRAYSVKFMKTGPKFSKKGSPGMNNDEKWYAKTFIEEMQLFLTYDNYKNKTVIDEFLKRKGKYKRPSDEPNFVTSIPKILDNLIVFFVKSHTKE